MVNELTLLPTPQAQSSEYPWPRSIVISSTTSGSSVWKYLKVALAIFDVYSWFVSRLIPGAYLIFIHTLLESIFPIKVNLTTPSGISDNAQTKKRRNIKIIHLDHHLDWLLRWYRSANLTPVLSKNDNEDEGWYSAHDLKKNNASTGKINIVTTKEIAKLEIIATGIDLIYSPIIPVNQK